jgi:hypothetical protein
MPALRVALGRFDGSLRDAHKETWPSARARSGDHDRFLVRATSLAQEASELTQGQVWTIDSPTGRADARPVPQAPRRVDASRAQRDGARAAPPTLEWSALASARHAAVWPVDAGETTSVARVVYRRSRVAWSTRPEAYGVALGSGPSARIAALAESIERLGDAPCAPGEAGSARRCARSPAARGRRRSRAAVSRARLRDCGLSVRGLRPPRPAKDWCVATSLLTGRRRVVPASLVGRARIGRAVARGRDVERIRRPQPTASGRSRPRSSSSSSETRFSSDWYAPRGELMRLEGAGGLDGAQTFVMTQDIDVPVVLAVAVAPDGALRSGSAARSPWTMRSGARTPSSPWR